MNVREQMAVRERAKRFWDGLSTVQRGELGGALVFGTLDWTEWLDRKPPAGFWRAVDDLRILWEMETSG